MSSTILLRKYQMICPPDKIRYCFCFYISESEEREEIAADIPAPANIPAPTLERVEEQSHTPGSRKSTRKNLRRLASTSSDFYM